jgi:cob(I)alamin adenosyltransferase
MSNDQKPDTQKSDIQTPPTKRKTEKAQGERRGLVIINTGHGKGKTTAALGLLLRAHGRGLRTRLYQFIKHEGAKFGENRALSDLGVPFAGLGDGFSWRSQDLERSKALAREGWEEAKRAILSGDYDLVVLDEVTYPVSWGWIAVDEVLETLRARPPKMHVVLTGRDAHAQLIEAADTVTEMKKVKHAFDGGVPAQRGIEH